jgi:hypothetical protein
MDAKEAVIKLEMQGTDQQSGQTGSMVVTVDEWIAPEVAGYGEVREFYKRMAARIDWGGAGTMFASRPDVVKGLAEARKQAANLEGVPVLSVITMTGSPSQDGTPPPPRPSLGGLIGAGIGVKRTKTDSDAPANSGASSGSLLEMTTELSSFSSEAVDDGQFAVPPGFKKFEMRMQ